MKDDSIVVAAGLGSVLRYRAEIEIRKEQHFEGSQPLQFDGDDDSKGDGDGVFAGQRRVSFLLGTLVSGA